ncbi:hypothetical protein UVI_02038010 [Ustilaginoidea virens]|uniref:Pre-mRNA-splicing factor n=1 Tax=Ustilaginoidea virens TaxID=1159556 RepID=A0A1B5KT69_USTVR|nr:hypothetical protein UVI_02038010 [Ustilaginoidea virens]
MTESTRGRVAIKFGASSTAPSKPASRTAPPSSLGKRRLRTHLGDESDSDSGVHDHRSTAGRHEAITGFGADGAETDGAGTDGAKGRAEAARRDYVIARQANRDWRAQAKAQRRGRNLLAEEARPRGRDAGGGGDGRAADERGRLGWGLTLATRSDDDDDDGQQPGHPSPPPATAEAPKDPPLRTADEEAMDALLGKDKGAEAARTIAAPTEDDVYRRDAAEAGVASTLEDYEAMPVEEFGAALLRGMGWDGTHTGPKTKEVRRRQNRLGLGAKELKGAEDLGGWMQKKGKKSRTSLADYRREESLRKEEGGRKDSYKREREKERERDGERSRYRERDRGRDGHKDDRRDRDRRESG